MNKIIDIPPAPGLGAICVGAAMSDDDRVHLSVMRRDPAGGTTLLLADSFAVSDLHGRDQLLLGAGLREIPTRRVSTSGWLQVIPEAAPTTLQWDDEPAPPATVPLDVDGKTATDDPMLAYYRDWYTLQTLKGDPARRGNLARDAYLSGAAQGALLARTTSVTIRAPLVDKARATPVDEPQDLQGQPATGWAAVGRLVSEYVEGYEMRGDGDYTPTESERLLIEDAIHGLLADDEFLLALESARADSTPAGTLTDDELDALDTMSLAHLAPRQRESVRAYGRAVIAALAIRQARDRKPPTVAECIANLDLWNDRLEHAIDSKAEAELGQHANDGPAAGGRDPMEQLP